MKKAVFTLAITAMVIFSSCSTTSRFPGFDAPKKSRSQVRKERKAFDPPQSKGRRKMAKDHPLSFINPWD